jgi:hypothetical protein
MAEKLGLELPEEVQGTEQELQLPELQPEVPSSVSELNALTGAILGMKVGQDFDTTYETIKGSSDPEAETQSLTGQFYQAEKSLTEDNFLELTNQFPDLIPEEFAKARQKFNQLANEELSALQKQAATVRTLIPGTGEAEVTAEEDLLNLTMRNVAENLAAQEAIQKMSADVGFLEGAYNLANFMFISPENWKDLEDFSDFSLDDKPVDGQTVSSMVSKWQTLPLETRQELRPKLQEFALEAADGNELKAETYMSYFFMNDGETQAEFDLRLEQLFSVVDVATPLAGMLARIGKATNGIKQLLKAAGIGGNDKILSALAKRAAQMIKEPGKAKNVGLTHEEAVNNAVPFNNSGHHPEKIVEESLHVRNELRSLDLTSTEATHPDFNTRLQSFESQLQQGDAFLKERVFTDLELDKITNQEVKLAAKKYEADNFETELVSADLMDDPLGQRLSLKITSPEGVVTVERDLKLSDKSDIFEKLDGTLARRKAGLSPRQTYRSLTGQESVNQAIRLDSASATLTKQLVDLGEEAYDFKNLSKKELLDLEDILLHGDAEELVFSDLQLREGVMVGDRLVQLGDNQIKSYRNIRQLWDFTHSEKSKAAARELNLQGFRQVEDAQIGKAIVKPLETKQAASVSDAKYVYDSELDEIIEVTSETLDQIYDQRGLKIVKAHPDLDLRIPIGSATQKEGAVIKHFLTKSTDRVSMSVIPKRTGYVYKEFKGVEWIARSVDEVTDIAGETKKVFKTERLFTSKKDAETFAKAESIRTGRVFEATQDREAIAQELGAGESLKPLGGKRRSRREILYGLQGTDPARISAREAMSVSLRRLGHNLSVNEWRLSQEQLLLNTYNKHFTGAPASSIEEAIGNLEKFKNSGEKGNRIAGDLLTHAEQIRFWTRVPSQEESLYTRLIDAAVNKVSNPTIQRALNELKDISPASKAKTTAYHLFLGMGNPAQLIVQGSNALVAVSRYPKFGAKGLRFMNFARTADKLDNLQEVEKLFDVGAKYGKLEKGEKALFLEMYKGWKRSGLADALKTNADLSSFERGFNSSGILSKASNLSMYLWRQGELFNRRFAYATSFQEKMASLKGRKLTPDGEREILTDANKTLLELNRANSAAWQEWLGGVPTQFLQVLTKPLESAVSGLFGGVGFTRGEIARFTGVYASILGASAMPYGDFFIDSILEANQIDPIQFRIDNPNADKLIRDGALGWGMWSLFGADISIGKRVSIARGWGDFIEEVIRDEGVSLLTLDNIPAASAMGNLLALPRVLLGSLKNSLVGEPVSEAELVQAVTGIASSTSNLYKAWTLYSTGTYFDRWGNVVTNYDPDVTGQAIAQALGFSNEEVARLQNKSFTRTERLKVEREEIGNIVTRMNYYLAQKIPPEDYAAVLRKEIQLNLTKYDDNAKQRIIEGVWRKINSGETSEERILKQALVDDPVRATDGILTLLFSNKDD